MALQVIVYGHQHSPTFAPWTPSVWTKHGFLEGDCYSTLAIVPTSVESLSINVAMMVMVMVMVMGMVMVTNPKML